MSGLTSAQVRRIVEDCVVAELQYRRTDFEFGCDLRDIAHHIARNVERELDLQGLLIVRGTVLWADHR